MWHFCSCFVLLCKLSLCHCESESFPSKADTNSSLLKFEVEFFFGARSQYTNCAEQGAKGYIGLHQKYHCWPISGTMARDNCNRGRSHQPSPHSHSVERSSNSMRMRRTWRAQSLVFRQKHGEALRFFVLDASVSVSVKFM